MSTRAPAVAGMFYPGSFEDCQAAIKSLLASLPERADPGGWAPLGGIVPHAGWRFSGAVAAEVLRALMSPETPETIVLFGAVHRVLPHSPGCLWPGATWHTPLGDADLDEPLASALLKDTYLFLSDDAPHAEEHSIEVHLPIIRHLSPSVRVLPVIVPPIDAAVEVGEAVAQCAARLGRRAVFVGSTDLTHYGPRYGFTPRGSGPEGLAWAKKVNDRRMLDLIERLEADKIVPEAAEHHNACGGGAVAATIAACRSAGARQARVLRHTTSSEVAGGLFGMMEDSVGYAGVVFGNTA